MEILKKVAELNAELDSLHPLEKGREADIMQKLRLDWNYHSNHLEGNSLTFGETKALILFGITAAGKLLKDQFEMIGHDEAVKWVEEVVKEGRPLTEMFIRELHKLILKEPHEIPTITLDGIPVKRIIHFDEYKISPKHVLAPTGVVFRFATPDETPAMMHDLIEWYRAKESDPETHPLLTAAEFHYKFTRIHPIDDGNVRSARILMNFIMMKHGYPPVVVKTEDKANYFAALQQSNASIITPIIEYIGKNLAHSLEIMLRGAKGENIDEADDVNKEIALIEYKLKGIGSEVLIEKTDEILLSLYDKFILSILLRYYEKYSKFDSFYIYSRGRIMFSQNDSSPSFYDLEDVTLEKIKSYFVKNRVKIMFGIKLEFSKFNRKGFSQFDFTSTIKISFSLIEYSIESINEKMKFKFFCDEIPSDELIDELIRSKTKAHTDFINQQIELAQKKSES